MKIILVLVLLALCLALTSAKTLQTPVQAKSNGKCQLCKYIVKEVQSLVAKQDLDAAKIAKKVCSVVPKVAVCSTIVEGLVREIAQLLQDGEVPEKVCELVNVCGKTAFLGRMSAEDATKVFLSMNSNFNSNGTCSMCKLIVQKAEDLIHDNEDNVEKKLLSVCKLLPDTSLEQMCDTIVVLYGPQIIQYILTHGDPEKLCSTIGLCHKSAAPAAVLVVEEPVAVPVQAKTDGCALCTYIIGLAEDYIKNDHSQQKIQESLEKVCKILPGQLGEQCEALVKAYEPVIIDYITKKYSPKKICELIGVCSKNEKAAEQAAAFEKAKSGACPLCTYVLGVVEDYLKDDRTQKKIEESLEKACSLLPSGLKSQCEALVKAYEPQLVDYLLKKYTPKQICQLIGACDKTKRASVAALQPEKIKSDTTCGLCKLVVSYVEQFIADGKNEKEVEALVERACQLLPGAFASQCEALVKVYLPQIIHLIVNKYPADKVCKLIKLCE